MLDYRNPACLTGNSYVTSMLSFLRESGSVLSPCPFLRKVIWSEAFLLGHATRFPPPTELTGSLHVRDLPIMICEVCSR